MDWSYAAALARRLGDRPTLVPADDPVWPWLLEPVPCERLTRAWTAGHMALLRRWGVDRAMGALPSSFEHRDGMIVIVVGGVVVASVAVAELLTGATMTLACPGRKIRERETRPPAPGFGAARESQTVCCPRQHSPRPSRTAQDGRKFPRRWSPASEPCREPLAGATVNTGTNIADKVPPPPAPARVSVRDRRFSELVCAHGCASVPPTSPGDAQ